MATIDDKDKKIGEVPHLEKVTGGEKIPVSANGEPGYVEIQQIRQGLLTEEQAKEEYQPKGKYQPEGDYLTQEEADKRYATPNDIPDVSGFVTDETAKKTFIPKTDITQEEGDSETKVMSQKAVSEAIKNACKCEGVTWGKIGKKFPATTVIRLNQTISDPYSMLSGEFGKDGDPKTNVVSWIRANSHRYVGNYDAEQGMVLRQLDDNNSELYADGSDASEDIKGTNGGDVFVKLPDFWFKGVNVDGNADIVDMHFSAIEPADEGWTKWDGNTLIGAYKAVAETTGNNANGALFSRSGVTPSVSISQANFKTKARSKTNGDDHFQIVTYEAHQVMALLYMAYYGNTDGQETIGAGTDSYPKVTGITKVDGMNDTVTENSRSINFWGLENWWGDIFEWMDNLESYNTSGGVNVLDYDGRTKRQMQGTTSSGYITKMLLGETLDMLARVTYGSTNTYYCDFGSVNTNTGRVAYRSYSNTNVIGGPFCLNVNSDSSTAIGYSGSRLSYYGRVTISKGSRNASMMKTRSLLPSWQPIDLQYVYRNSTPILRTGFEFNICNVSSLQQVGKLSLFGLNITYQEIEFESNACQADSQGNITFNTDGMPESIDMNYKGQLIGTLKFYDISEEELIERQRQMNEQNTNA